MKWRSSYYYYRPFVFIDIVERIALLLFSSEQIKVFICCHYSSRKKQKQRDKNCDALYWVTLTAQYRSYEWLYCLNVQPIFRIKWDTKKTETRNTNKNTIWNREKNDLGNTETIQYETGRKRLRQKWTKEMKNAVWCIKDIFQ
jgi:hypothetical protein